MTRENAVSYIRETWREICLAIPFCHSPQIVVTLALAGELDEAVENAYIYSWNIVHIDAKFIPTKTYEDGFEIHYLQASCILEFNLTNDPLCSYTLDLSWDGIKEDKKSLPREKAELIDREWRRWLEIEDEF